MPGAMAYAPDKPALLFIGLDAQGVSTASFVTPSGSVLGHWEYPNNVLTNVAYDIKTGRAYVNAYISSEQKNYVLELASNGSITKMVQVPGVVQVCLEGEMCFV